MLQRPRRAAALRAALAVAAAAVVACALATRGSIALFWRHLHGTHLAHEDGESRAKQACEMNWWNRKHAEEGGRLRNAHYRQLYTTFFGVGADAYDGKRVLDLGWG